MMTSPRFRLAASAATLLAVLLAACGSTTPTTDTAASGSGTTVTATPDPSSRPSSPAVLSIVSPTEGQSVTGGVVHVAVSLNKAHIVATTSTNITPDTGHVHLYLDNNLIYMQYSLTQDVPVHPGTYSLKAEFVAADHFPFNPRVWSTQTIVFTVK
jgi:hypothetical protein